MTQQELDTFLELSGLNLGDFCAYMRLGQADPVYSERCVVIFDVERDIEKVDFDAWGKPRPYRIMGLNGTGNLARSAECNFNTTPYVRYDSGDSLYRLTANQYQKVNDDFVQNYIKKHRHLLDGTTPP